jgi:hypothetical protein
MSSLVNLGLLLGGSMLLAGIPYVIDYFYGPSISNILKLEGWTTCYNENHKKWIYYNEKTNKYSVEIPKFISTVTKVINYYNQNKLTRSDTKYLLKKFNHNNISNIDIDNINKYLSKFNKEEAEERIKEEENRKREEEREEREKEREEQEEERREQEEKVNNLTERLRVLENRQYYSDSDSDSDSDNGYYYDISQPSNTSAHQQAYNCIVGY